MEEVGFCGGGRGGLGEDVDVGDEGVPGGVGGGGAQDGED